MFKKYYATWILTQQKAAEARVKAKIEELKTTRLLSEDHVQEMMNAANDAAAADAVYHQIIRDHVVTIGLEFSLGFMHRLFMPAHLQVMYYMMLTTYLLTLEEIVKGQLATETMQKIMDIAQHAKAENLAPNVDWNNPNIPEA